jgi:hypothetical protein
MYPVKCVWVTPTSYDRSTLSSDVGSRRRESTSDDIYDVSDFVTLCSFLKDNPPSMFFLNSITKLAKCQANESSK